MKYVFLTGFLALSLNGMNPDDRPLPAWHCGGKLQKILEDDKTRLLGQQHAREQNLEVASTGSIFDSAGSVGKGDVDALLAADVLGQESAESEAQELESLRQQMLALSKKLETQREEDLETQREEDRERFAALTRLAAAPARPTPGIESLAERRVMIPEEERRAEREAAEQLLRLFGLLGE